MRILIELVSSLRAKRSNPYTEKVIKGGYVYILANATNTVLYVGVCADITKRIYQHRMKIVEGFTKKYNVTKLVYYEIFSDIQSAILREKQIKGGSRKKKIDLIIMMNPEWKDLYENILE